MFEVHSLQGHATSQSETISSNPYHLYWYVFPQALMAVTPTYHLSGTNLYDALHHSSLSYMREAWSFYWRCFAHVLMIIIIITIILIVMMMMMMMMMVITRSLKIRYKTPKASSKQKLSASLLIHVSFYLHGVIATIKQIVSFKWWAFGLVRRWHSLHQDLK